ncbi:c-type cytochrome [Caenimonas sedimenti]|uniref:C-type cytochrome n=1 Tax=Caenimonas sedimenti TaxID=2596921 RepID=A0A562ZK71_9BURK|nr:c-type cytochrome [Caenimonas sedimenti]TWO68726.1 c-type cytochrome [Caenimonas sedimenti]
MRRTAARVLLAGCAGLLALPATTQESDFPAWAYPLTPLPLPQRVADDGTVFRVPGSDKGFTRDQSRDPFAPPDWHPADHPAMPPIVAQGRKPALWACGMCHRPNGGGGPENANISGLPADYIVQQIQEMASGARSSAVPTNRLAHTLKQNVVKNVTPEELKAAAAYFEKTRPAQVMVVAETAMIPKLKATPFFLTSAGDGTQEPLGNRIIEYPEDYERFSVLRDERVKFVVHVPPGSIQKGEELVRGMKGNKALACMNCHGEKLQGMAAFPPIAGRSPAYMVRQMWDFKQGARNGAMAAVMKPVVAELSGTDMLNIAAYLATLKP